jgi:glycosyltransferase involved in cell wall biosynthesis
MRIARLYHKTFCDFTQVKKVIETVTLHSMRALMLSGDPRILELGTPVWERFEAQRAEVEQLDVFVWPRVHSQVTVWRLMRKNHYDVITTQDPVWRGLLAWKLSALTGVKLNVQVHTDLRAQSFLRRTLAGIVLRRADSVRVVSEKIKQQVTEMGVRAPIHVLPIFIDAEEFRRIERRPHTQKTILWVGRFEEEKDPAAAIRILRQVRDAGIDAKLVMLGAGSRGQELRRLASGLPVDFPGWQDPKQYLSVADVVLSTSLHESWGASMIEALLAGVPVVAPDVGIAREAGAIIAAREELGAAVTRVLNSGERGTLCLSLSTKEEWAKRWRDTLQ